MRRHDRRGKATMPNAQEGRRQKIVDVFNLACQMAKRKTAKELVLICRPIEGGMAITCRAEDRSIIELRFYVRSDDNIFLVDKLGQEAAIGMLDDDVIQNQIADAIVNKTAGQSPS